VLKVVNSMRSLELLNRLLELSLPLICEVLVYGLSDEWVEKLRLSVIIILDYDLIFNF
jgi:hypothetical protein